MSEIVPLLSHLDAPLTDQLFLSVLVLRRPSGDYGIQHEPITYIRWLQNGTTTAKISTPAEMVAFVEDDGKAYVKDSAGDVAFLGVRLSSAGNKYVRTHADGIWNDNLLALPRF
jgi:hypothetical protein